MRLARIAFAGVTSEGLRPGDWRYLTVDELTALKKEHNVPRRVVSPPVQPPKRARRAWTPPHGEEAADRKPRYGGGAPGRRDLGVKEDWGGGVRRGSSGTRDEDRTPRADVGGGRSGGRTRTTGTGGGIGAGEGSYRVRGRRG